MTNLHVQMDQDDSQGDEWCARLDQKTASKLDHIFVHNNLYHHLVPILQTLFQQLMGNGTIPFYCKRVLETCDD